MPINCFKLSCTHSFLMIMMSSVCRYRQSYNNFHSFQWHSGNLWTWSVKQYMTLYSLFAVRVVDCIIANYAIFHDHSVIIFSRTFQHSPLPYIQFESHNSKKLYSVWHLHCWALHPPQMYLYDSPLKLLFEILHEQHSYKCP